MSSFPPASGPDAFAAAQRYPVWSRITWYWIGVGLGTCLGVTLGYLLTISGVL